MPRNVYPDLKRYQLERSRKISGHIHTELCFCMFYVVSQIICIQLLKVADPETFVDLFFTREGVEMTSLGLMNLCNFFQGISVRPQCERYEMQDGGTRTGC